MGEVVCIIRIFVMNLIILFNRNKSHIMLCSRYFYNDTTFNYELIDQQQNHYMEIYGIYADKLKLL